MSIQASEEKFEQLADALVPSLFDYVETWKDGEPAVATKRKNSQILHRMENNYDSMMPDENVAYLDVKRAMLYLEEEGYIQSKEVHGNTRWDFHTLDGEGLTEHYNELSEEETEEHEPEPRYDSEDERRQDMKAAAELVNGF